MPLNANNNPETLGMEEVKDLLALAIREASRAKTIMKLRSLKRTLENVTIVQNISNGILDYVAAAAVLAFACRSPNSDNIRKLLLAVDKEPHELFLSAIAGMHYKNYDLYLNIIYAFVELKIPPTIDKTIEMLWALEESPDALLAGYVIEYYNEFVQGKMGLNTISFEGEAIQAYEKMYEVTFHVYEDLSRFVAAEMTRITGNPGVAKRTGSELLPYLSAICLLGLSGKEIDKGNIRKVLGACDVESNDGILDDLAPARIKSHSIYIIGLYFLNAVNKEQNLENILRVVMAFGIRPDATIAEYALNFYRVKGLTKGLDK